MAAGMKKGDCVVGVDIGGTKIMAAVLGHKFGILGRERKKTQGKNGGLTAEELEQASTQKGYERLTEELAPTGAGAAGGGEEG